MRILITGGLGFIGSHLSNRLVSDGHNVLIIDNRSNNKVDKIEGAKIVSYFSKSPERRFVEDVVINLAAKASISSEISNEMYEANISLFDQAKNTLSRKFIYASSAAIYHPYNQYAHTKLYNEWAVKDWTDATGLRFFNIYGKHDNGVVGKIFKAIKEGKEFVINGGDQVRDFVYIDDAVDQIIKAIHSQEQIIEVGTGIGTTITSLASLCVGIAGKGSGRWEAPIEDEQQVSVCKGGLKTFTPLAEGLKKYWDDL